MDKLLKFLDVDVEKAAGAANQMWFTASTAHRDRQGDVLVQEGWKLGNYKKNPVFLWAHDYGRPPIGKSLEISVTDKGLRSKVEFVPPHIDPFAEQVRQLYAEGFMKTVSVGFITYKREPLTEEDKKQRPEMSWGERLSGELLEFSAVPVPANPMALQNGFLEAVAKGLGRAALPQPAQVSKLLRVDSPEMIRASMLALLGARGGIPGMSEQERKTQFDLLKAFAEETQLSGSGIENLAWGDDPEKIRSLPGHADIWGGALLDVIQHAKEAAPEPPTVPADQMAAVGSVLEAMKTNLDAVNAALK